MRTAKIRFRDTDMLQGNPLRLILRFSVPLMIGNLFTQLYSLIDAAIVGRYVGVDAFAAVGCTGWIAWLLVALCRDGSSAICVMASFQIGAKKPDEFKKVIATSFYLGAALALIVCTTMLAAMDPVLRLNQVPSEIYDDAKTYLWIYTLAIPFCMVCYMASALLRAMGNNRAPLCAMVASALINIVLDFYFVAMLHMGVEGAAWATFIAQGVSALIALGGLAASESCRLRRRHWKPDGTLVKRAILLWLPMFWNSLIIMAGGVYVQSCVNGVGAEFSAGFSAAIKIFSVVEMLVIAVQTALSVFIGQNFGAGQIRRIRTGFFKTLFASELIMAGLIACAWLFGDSIIAMLLSSKDANAYQIAFATAHRQLRFIMLGAIVMVPMFYFRAASQALGHPNSTLIAGIAQMLARILTITILFPCLGTLSYHLTDQVAWLVSLPVVAVPFLYHLKALTVKEAPAAVKT